MLLVREVLLAPLLLSDTPPVKLLLALVKVIALAPALKVATPAPAACVIEPACVIAPVAVMPKVPLPTDEVPRASAPAFVSATLLAPLLFNMTLPVKLLPALERVITPAPALMLAAPAAAA